MTANLLVILGPTASGKTRLGVELARLYNGEIISADSRQVYRGMDIGTGKDLAEYGLTPYHLIDIVDPGYEFNIFEFQRRFQQAYQDIAGRGRLPVMVGGTGMYLDAVLRRYRLVEVPENSLLRRELHELSSDALLERLKAAKPDLHNTTDTSDRSRLIRAIEIAEFDGPDQEPFMPELSPLVFGIRWERSDLRRRITDRLKSRLQEGMIEEVKRLREAGVSYETMEFYGLEYRYAARYLQGLMNRNDMFQKLNSAIHDFAKRQCTWFSRMERHGIEINWLEGGNDPLLQALEIIKNSNLIPPSQLRP